jgi:cyanophycin synthetase
MHLDPVEGTPRPVGKAILETMFGPGEEGRVPSVLVSGGARRKSTVSVLTRLLSVLFPELGAATHAGIFAGSRFISKAPSDIAEGVMRLVMHRGVQVLLAERSPEGIVREGVFLDRAKVALLTDSDSGTANGTRAAELILEGASHLILPADAGRLGPSRATRSLFGKETEERLLSFAASGGRVAYAQSGAVVLREGESLHRVLLGPGALHWGQEEEFCAAALAAWALGAPPAKLLEVLTQSEHWT